MSQKWLGSVWRRTFDSGISPTSYGRRWIWEDESYGSTFDQAKAKKAMSVTLSAEAMLVLRRKQEKYQTRVFVFRGYPCTR
jgi:hypothetical protein